MLILAGADIVLADRVVTRGTVVIEGRRILEVRPGDVSGSAADVRVDLAGYYVLPGFIDVHVHGVAGHDVLDGPAAVSSIAATLPRYGVTAFCPTTVACMPERLRMALEAVQAARVSPKPGSARVLPAHLESNFINPEYRGAQPVECLRRPPHPGEPERPPPAAQSSQGYGAAEILAEIARARPDVGIVTLAPELEHAMPLVQHLAGQGHRVALGHSAATYEQTLAAIASGARHATHLFNRMPPINHRVPGLAGAVLASDEVAAELICDGYHVHPSMVRVAIAAKSPSRVMAITDGTAGSGMPAGSRGSLGGQPITVKDSAAFLDDGTLAGSVWTMDRAYAVLVSQVGLSLPDAALLCSTTPARELGLTGMGTIAAGAFADLVVLSNRFAVAQTYVGGELVYDAKG
ncbi:MAG: N-acetylglucosamine-6-phosphate deacetylase [Acidobacteria bacterium]|nr:N-acetylglucosamine-6-phosphate deacetylase [Acidobacteriota bacterium]